MLIQRQKEIWYMLLMLSFILIIIFTMYSGSTLENLPAISLQLYAPKVEIYEIDTKGCRIPKLDPYDPAIKSYIAIVNEQLCGNKPLILANQTSIWIDKSVLNDSVSTVDCCYKVFQREVFAKDGDFKADHHVSMSSKCTSFNGSADIYDEYVEVSCQHDGKEVYKDYHAFMVRKRPNEVIPRSMPHSKPSVIVIGLDSVSKVNFYRQMPLLHQFLINEEAIEFQGFNKVGDNTFPNIMPFLTGHSVEELKETCWKNETDKFDKCHYVWDDFKSNGYLTAFAEDTCWMGLFLYLKRGFFKQPTDYYTQPFMKLNEDVIGNKWVGNSYSCLGQRPALQVLYDYTEKLTVNFTKEQLPFFGHFWGTSLSHDSININKEAEMIYLRLFESFKKEGVFNSSIVIFMSDHGLRWGGIRSTHQGRLEDRLPYLYIMLPTWFRQDNQQATDNMITNTKRLVTTFDLHATMLDLTDVSLLSDSKIKERSSTVKNTRGISLFLPVPEERKCADGGVSEEWCTCHDSRNISADDSFAVSMAKVVVDEINKIIVDNPQCAALTTDKVLSARLVMPPDDSTNVFLQDVMLMLSTKPGGGNFEATVSYDESTSKGVVSGYISRINAYGNSSHCVHQTKLKLYCYCVK